MRAIGLYSHIRANQARSMLLLAWLFLLVMAAAVTVVFAWEASHARDGFDMMWQRTLDRVPLVLPVAFFATLSWIAVAFLTNTGIIAWAVKSRAPMPAEERRLKGLVEPLCISRGERVPELQIIDTPQLNAFASGMADDQYTITVTKGMFDELDDRELEAVLAHELTHIRNDDVRLMMVATIIVGIFSFLFEIKETTSSVWRASERKDGLLAFGISFAVFLICCLLGSMGRLALSRRREFLADAGAVELTKNPDALVSALRKIDGRSEIAGSPSSVMEMAIASGEGQFADLFSTHPSMEKRIDALQRFAGASRDVLKVETPIAISRAPPSRAEVPHNAAGGSPRTFLRRVKPPP